MHQPAEKLTGKVVLVAGGTNAMGSSIVRYFLEADATVIVPGKCLGEITKLKEGIANIKSGTLITQLTELPDYDRGFDIAEAIVEKFGRIDIGIAVFNGQPCNRQLTEAHISDWQNMVDDEVTPFFVCARLILHTMKASKGGLYVSLCDSSLFKHEDSPPLSKIAANMKMEMSKIFAEETRKYNVKYYHLWVKQDEPLIELAGNHQDGSVVGSEMIGNQIVKLYLSKSDKPDEVFRLCPENNAP